MKVRSVALRASPVTLVFASLTRCEGKLYTKTINCLRLNKSRISFLTTMRCLVASFEVSEQSGGARSDPLLTRLPEMFGAFAELLFS